MSMSDTISRIVKHSHNRNAMSQKNVITLVVCILLAVGLGYWILSPSTIDLLDKETLTPEQIRAVASKLLLHDDVKIRERASEKLTSLGQQAVPVLKELCLAGAESQLKMALLGIIMPIDTDAAVEILENMYNDTDFKVRSFALDGAQQIDDPRADAIMIKALDDPEDGIRSAAAGKMSMKGKGVKSAIPKLKEALDDPNPRVRRHAARSLLKMTGVDYSDRVRSR